MLGSTTARGYGYAHKKRRERDAIKVKRGEAFCTHPNCGRWISPSEPWDLGHNPFDRSQYLGPMHRRCNRDTRLEKSLRRPRRARPSAASWL